MTETQTPAPAPAPVERLVNKTLTAGIGLGLLAFSMGAIVYFAIWGDDASAIHYYSNGAAWWTLWFLAGAFGLGAGAVALLPALRVAR